MRWFSSPRFGSAESSYTLTRFVLLRGSGFIYSVAFSIVWFQFPALCGSKGLLPAADFLRWVAERLGSRGAGFARLPSIFWLSASDASLRGAAIAGLVLSIAALLGYSNAITQALLWALYLSFVHVGQIFYGYGWESLLCEAGFLAIFLAEPWRLHPFSPSPPPTLVIVLFRWLTFRVMFGAGLIKLRGDACWRELSCLSYHYETQPNPGPLSIYFHRMPDVFHRLGVLFNHAVELVAPFFVFGPRRARLVAGASIVTFQVVLILSGNLSFLNWLTLIVALSCFDDGVFARLLPRALSKRAADIERVSVLGRSRRVVLVVLSIAVALLSVNPAVNMLSPRQAMNASFDPLMLVNTYGAFGSVGRERLGAIIQGTNDIDPAPAAHWETYELPCQVGAPERRPCLVTPYHYRLDWQMWFVPLAGPVAAPEPWLVHLVARLLEADPLVLSLFQKNPFPSSPPRFVRVALYRYRFSRPGEAGYWQREYLGNILPPLSRDDPELHRYLAERGWE
ncbi:MAG TPA: lipase maturation factor family protein [Polyangiaceae bacterium]|nr:lipase maturation factor family protein [Polyangiaceae bacterium]